MDSNCNETAFPRLTDAEISTIEILGTHREYEDGAYAFHAGDRDMDLLIVETGELEIVNPRDGNRLVAVHGPGHFSGDIDVLTGRPVVVSAIARGQTRLLRIPGERVREVLLRLPQISEKLVLAFQERRRLLTALGNVGLKVCGPAECPDTNLIREFLDKNFVPYTWHRTNVAEDVEQMHSEAHGPVVDCGNGIVLKSPTLREIAHCAGVWRECPTEPMDLAIVGSGPAGMSAAVYAASEGIRTLVIDALGPGGQAAASSKIENFIGFPAGLSGTELATRAVIQMLKFGAQIVAPVHVDRLETPAEPDGYLKLHLNCGTVVTARHVLIASGLAWRHLGALGTQRFEQAGIYYACTATETISHRNEDVAVVGAGNSAGQAAMFLAEQCANKVHILMRGSDLGASMSSYLVDRIKAAQNIEVHSGVEITRVIDDGGLKGVEIRGYDGHDELLSVRALFVFIGAEPQISWLPDCVARDAKGYLFTGADASASGRWPLTDRAPCPLETTIPRLFAAGDIRASSTKRVGFAVGDGALAVACVHTLRTPASA